MEYYYSVKDTHNYIHSIDNCVVSYYLKCNIETAINILKERGEKREEYWENINKKACSKFSYYQNHIHYDTGIYIMIGKYKLFLEDKKKFELLPIIKFEINPNKHYQRESFQEIMQFIKENCTDGHLEKYDYAIDIPVPLDDIQIFGTRKEKGLYKGTRYYGQRNQHGYCKVYDKGKEQKQYDTLSRVEHTLNNNKDLSLESFFVRSTEAENDLSELPASTRVYVLLCLEIKQLGGDYESIIAQLGRDTRRKILKYLSGGYEKYEYDENIINELLKKINELFNISYTDVDGFIHVVDEPLPFD